MGIRIAAVPDFIDVFERNIAIYCCVVYVKAFLVAT